MAIIIKKKQLKKYYIKSKTIEKYFNYTKKDYYAKNCYELNIKKPKKWFKKV